jgi:Sulfotransferase domain
MSTAFERMMIERGDHTVIDEPFSRRYYFGPDKRSSRFAKGLPQSSAEAIVGSLEDAAKLRPVFVKDMAYHALGLLNANLLSRFRNSFLVRDPAETLRSLAKHWPDFTEEEAGWHALGVAADVIEQIGQPLVVVDADALGRNPTGVVAAWCAAMEIPFVPAALSWEPGLRPEWELWADWHAATAEASGFRAPTHLPLPPSDAEPRLRDAYERALPVYRRLRSHALAATPGPETIG